MPFRRRSSWLALLLSTFMVLAASAQSLHEQLAHDGVNQHCEYCLQAVDPDGVIPPLIIAIPALLVDIAPQLLIPFLAPRRSVVSVLPRAPPATPVLPS